MRLWQLMVALAGGIWVGFGLVPLSASAQEYEEYPLEARVWLDRGEEPVLQRGDRARIYYRVSESAFVAIFHVDTNGAVQMVFPSSPQENHFARGGRDYRVLFPGSSYWFVGDDPGMGYFFIVASPEPFDFRAFGYSHFAGGWDLGNVGRQIYGDPYLAMDDYVATLIPEWEYVGYGLDFTSYHVERHYDYPRFLCYDCHGFQPYYSWNPYSYSCTSFRVVIYNDPYYYPATRYRGTRVVYVQPRRGLAHFGFKERVVGEAGTPQVVVRNTPPVNQSGVEGATNRRAVPRTGAPAAFSPGATRGSTPGAAARRPTGVEGGATRRTGVTNPSAAVPTRQTTGAAAGAARPTSRTPLSGRTGTREAIRGPVPSSNPGLERRPGGTGASATPPKPTGSTRTPVTRTPVTRAPVTRPSVKVRRPGGGGGAAQTTGNGGSQGAASRGTPTVRSGGTPTRSTPTVRSGGTPTRSTPTVRSPASAKKPPARITRPPTVTTKAKPKPKRPVGGRGGGGCPS